MNIIYFIRHMGFTHWTASPINEESEDDWVSHHFLEAPVFQHVPVIPWVWRCLEPKDPAKAPCPSPAVQVPLQQGDAVFFLGALKA